MKITKSKKTVFLTLLLVLAFLFLVSPSYALEVKKKTLENGLVLMIVERHNLPIVKVSIGLDAGNLREPAEKAGLANLTASLLTEGTKNRTAQQISEEIEFVGGDVGAAGGEDYVSASLSILKRDIDLGFELLADIILNPVFPEDELEKKRERVKAGLKAQEEDPGFVASKNFQKTLFGDHPYGRLVTGTAETLDRIGRDDLVAFHDQYYVPNNAIMAVVGDISPDEVERLIEKHFRSWVKKDLRKNALPPLDTAREKKTVTVDKDLTQATVILGHIGVSRSDPDYYKLSVMNYILGSGGFASRLMQNIREDRGLVYSIYSHFAADKYGGSFQVILQTKNESANEAIEEVLKEIRRIRSSPVSDTELSDAQSFLTGSFPMRIETSSRIAGFLVAVEYYGLGIDYIDNYPGFINSITKTDVLEAAKKYLDPENFLLVVVADQEKADLKETLK